MFGNFFSKKPRVKSVLELETLSFISEFMGQKYHALYSRDLEGELKIPLERRLAQCIRTLALTGLSLKSALPGQGVFPDFWRAQIHAYFEKAYMACVIGSMNVDMIAILLLDFQISCRHLTSGHDELTISCIPNLLEVMNIIYGAEGGYILNCPLSKILQKSSFLKTDKSLRTTLAIWRLMLELQLVTTDAVRTLYDAAKLHPGNLTSQEVVSIRDTYLFHGLFFYYLGMVLERVDTSSQGDFNATFFMALTVFAEDCYGTMPALVFETVEAEFIAQENDAALARFLRHLGEDHPLFKHLVDLESNAGSGFTSRISYNYTTGLFLLSLKGKEGVCTAIARSLLDIDFSDEQILKGYPNLGCVGQLK